LTQAAHVQQLAPVIDLDEWRFAHLADGERAALLRQRGKSRPIPISWESLLGANMSDARDAAAIIARLGGHPIAVHGARPDGSCTCERPNCAAAGKHPVEPGWQRSPLDLERLDTMLRERWELNLGWRMGVQPGGYVLVAIDVDGPRNLLEPVEREHGPMPPTLTATTARGLHMLYRVPPDRVLRNRVRLAPGVDVRAAGGMIVVAPSRHVSGARYRWTDAREPEQLS
jgi:putative DNA primase/helicase